MAEYQGYAAPNDSNNAALEQARAFRKWFAVFGFPVPKIVNVTVAVFWQAPVLQEKDLEDTPNTPLHLFFEYASPSGGTPRRANVGFFLKPPLGDTTAIRRFKRVYKFVKTTEDGWEEHLLSLPDVINALNMLYAEKA